MPGDRWAQLANLRALYAWMWAHPGKKLLFMGVRAGRRAGVVATTGSWTGGCSTNGPTTPGCAAWWPNSTGFTGPSRPFGSRISAPEGFRWIDASDSDHNVLSFYRSRRPPLRRSERPRPSLGARGREDVVACLANLSPVPQIGYRVGLPEAGRWLELLNTDAQEWGGSGLGNMGEVWAHGLVWHGQPYSAEMVLPPLAVLWLAPAP